MVAHSLSEIQIFCNNLLEYLFSAIITELSFKSDQISKHSSVVEYSTAYREVLGQTRALPLRLFIEILKLRKFSHYIWLRIIKDKQ